MKIIIYFYKTEQPFPSDSLYKWIEGDSGKIFFSDRQDFNEANIKILLPPNPVQGKTYLFLVPQSWQSGFETLIKATLPNIDWQTDQYPTKPHKVKIDNNWAPKFGEFYDTLVFEGAIEGKFFEKPKKSIIPSIQLLGTLFPFVIPVLIVLPLVMYLTPSTKDILEKQIPKMLEIADKGLDQGLEKDIEETSYWAGDRILKLNAGHKEAKQLVEAVKEIETAQKECQKPPVLGAKNDSPPVPEMPIISEKLKQRNLATQGVIKQKPDLYTLQIARMSTGELNDWLEKLTSEQLENLFVYTQDKQSWKVTYGRFTKKEDAKGQIPDFVFNRCCQKTSLEEEGKNMLSQIDELDTQLTLSINSQINDEKKIQPNTKFYIPKKEKADIIKFCQFSKLGEC